MNLVKKTNNIFTLETELEQENEISEIGDIFEYSSVEKDEVIEVVNLMLSYVVQDIGGSVRENLLNAVNNALVYQNVGTEVSFDILLPYLSDFDEAHLSYVLSFLGFSGKKEYRSILEKYLIYDDEEIKEAAQEALCEIDFRIKKMNCN
ncbi:hypothetical protein ACE6ED_25455 [Paenibacillus sp. CN-4]|uniref:hypothetical protein n=1 Tax=Paenibacillus nanchangensis TaxID=3348343 RepID=UPI0039792C6E